MKKIMVCYASYTGEKKLFFDSLTENNFREYCHRNGLDFYMVKDKTQHSIDRHPTWMSWKIIDDLIDRGHLCEGDKVFSLDADTCIVDMNADLTTNKSFAYAIDSCNTHCMGFYSMTINDWSKRLVKNVLDERMYQNLRQTPIWNMWNDQASIYELFGIKRHSWIPFSLVENYGWHSAVSTYTKYSIEDLKNNVDIMPTEYNVTCVAGEGFNEYFVNPTKGKNTIIRHFAGSPKWDERYFSEVKR